MSSFGSSESDLVVTQGQKVIHGFTSADGRAYSRIGNEEQFIAQNLLGMKNLLQNVCGRPTEITPEALDRGYVEWMANRDPLDDPTDGILYLALHSASVLPIEPQWSGKLSRDR